MIQSLALFQLMGKKNNNQINVDIKSDLSEFQTDVVWFRQSLIQLMVNATSLLKMA